MAASVSPRGGSRAVRAARRDDAAVLGEVLAEAFAEDPVFAWLIPPQLRGRDNRLRTLFTSMSRGYLRRGKPCYLTDDASAAALWAAPGAWAMPLSQIVLEAVPNGQAFRGRLLRALRTQLQIERLHARQSRPHWYLGYLGTRRDRQGQGLGTQMLRKVLPGLDSDGIPAYLESSNERNLPLYERNGFRVVGELRALGHGPTIWRMWREPVRLSRGRGAARLTRSSLPASSAMTRPLAASTTFWADVPPPGVPPPLPGCQLPSLSRTTPRGRPW